MSLVQPELSEQEKTSTVNLTVASALASIVVLGVINNHPGTADTLGGVTVGYPALTQYFLSTFQSAERKLQQTFNHFGAQ